MDLGKRTTVRTKMFFLGEIIQCTKLGHDLRRINKKLNDLLFMNELNKQLRRSPVCELILQ